MDEVANNNKNNDDDIRVCSEVVYGTARRRIDDGTERGRELPGSPPGRVFAIHCAVTPFCCLSACPIVVRVVVGTRRSQRPVERDSGAL